MNEIQSLLAASLHSNDFGPFYDWLEERSCENLKLRIHRMLSRGEVQWLTNVYFSKLGEASLDSLESKAKFANQLLKQTSANSPTESYSYPAVDMDIQQLRPSEIELRRIGQSGLFVSPVALGCWPIAGMTSLGVNDEDSLATISAALESGINFIDTAHCYGANGESERLIGKAIKGKRDRIVLASKGGIHWDEKGIRHYDATPERILLECNESLRRMNVDHIDLFYLHAPDPQVPVEQSAEAFVSLLKSGKVRAVGASNFSVEELEKFQAVCPISAVQPPYNMLERAIESDIIPWCIANHVSVINYWPLMKGLLAGKIRRGHQFEANDKRLTYDVFQGEKFEAAQKLLDRLDFMAVKTDKTVAQIVVNWTIHQPGLTATLCGAKRDWQIRETAGGMGWKLDDADFHLINALITS